MRSRGLVIKLGVIAALGAFGAFAWLSLPAPPPSGGGDQGALTQGVVLALDRAANQVTISHGPLENLGMPSMTMTFQAGGSATLEPINAGDKVKFRAQMSGGGAFTVTRIERVAQ